MKYITLIFLAMNIAHATPDPIETEKTITTPPRSIVNGKESEIRQIGRIKKNSTPPNVKREDNSAEEDFVLLSDAEYDKQIEEEEMKRVAYLKLSEAGKELQKYLYTAGTNLSKKAYLKLLNAVEELKQYASSEGKKISQNVYSKLSEAGEELKKYTSSEGEKLSKNISSKLSEAGSALQDYVSSAGKNLSEKTYSILSNAGGALKNYAYNAASTAQQFLKKSANTASDSFKNLTQEASTGFEKLSNDIKSRWYSSQKPEQEQINSSENDDIKIEEIENNLSQSTESLNQEPSKGTTKSEIITVNKTPTEDPKNDSFFSRWSGWFST